MSMLVCLNGQFIPREDARLPIQDGAFLFGDSLFETLKARGKNILLLHEHLDRLDLSAKLLNLPCNRQKLETSLRQLASSLTAPTSRIRLTLSRGSHQGLGFPDVEAGWFLLTASPLEETNDQQREQGADCISAPNQRVNPLSHLPQMKRGNYADCLYAVNYAQQKGAREALFCDQQGQILEGATSNIFALIDHKLVTPPTGPLVLAGVMRRQVIAAATELGIRTVERKLNKTELFQAQEAFLTNSLIDILPINSLDGKAVSRGSSSSCRSGGIGRHVGLKNRCPPGVPVRFRPSVPSRRNSLRFVGGFFFVYSRPNATERSQELPDHRRRKERKKREVSRMALV